MSVTLVEAFYKSKSLSAASFCLTLVGTKVVTVENTFDFVGSRDAEVREKTLVDNIFGRVTPFLILHDMRRVNERRLTPA
jgi:hypothetical protein